MAKQTNKWVSLNPDAIGMQKYIDGFTNQHSKFIHSSWLLKSDHNREVTIDDKVYTIYGLWDVIGTRYMIMLRPVEKGPFRIEDSKVVSSALGYTRMRNQVTGEEHKWDFAKRKDWTYLGAPASKVTEKQIEDPETENENEEEDEYVDPVVKALLDSLIDDGDSSAQ
jgi:hypothetical protein